MRYVQLRAFHYVAICGGFSRASEALFLTQPAISDQVRKLEEEYDVLLFNRQKKQVTLTREGEALLVITRRLFDAESQALELLSESSALRSGRLRIVADAPHHILPILAQFRETYPGIRISLSSGNTRNVLDSLHAYEADIGILGELPEGRNLLTLKLNSSPIIAFARRDHPAAGRGRMRLDELAAWPLVMRERGSKTRHKLEETAAAQGLKLTAAIEAEGREAVREIVASGAGIGFVSTEEFGEDARLAIIVIDAPVMLMDEAVVCLRERSGGKVVQAFLGIVTRAVEG